MKHARIRRHSPELFAEIERIVSLKKQIPRYAEVAKNYDVSVQIVRHMISARMPALRTKVLIHVEPRRTPMTREELDRLVAQVMRESRSV